MNRMFAMWMCCGCDVSRKKEGRRRGRPINQYRRQPRSAVHSIHERDTKTLRLLNWDSQVITAYRVNISSTICRVESSTFLCPCRQLLSWVKTILFHKIVALSNNSPPSAGAHNMVLFQISDIKVLTHWSRAAPPTRVVYLAQDIVYDELYRRYLVQSMRMNFKSRPTSTPLSYILRSRHLSFPFDLRLSHLSLLYTLSPPRLIAYSHCLFRHIYTYIYTHVCLRGSTASCAFWPVWSKPFPLKSTTSDNETTLVQL